jgi:hypothetical protein
VLDLSLAGFWELAKAVEQRSKRNMVDQIRARRVSMYEEKSFQAAIGELSK